MPLPTLIIPNNTPGTKSGARILKLGERKFFFSDETVCAYMYKDEQVRLKFPIPETMRRHMHEMRCFDFEQVDSQLLVDIIELYYENLAKKIGVKK